MNKDAYVLELLKDGVLALERMSDAKLQTMLQGTQTSELRDKLGCEIMYSRNGFKK